MCVYKKSFYFYSENQRGYLTEFSICNFNRVDETKDTKDFFPPSSTVCAWLHAFHFDTRHPLYSEKLHKKKQNYPSTPPTPIPTHVLKLSGVFFKMFLTAQRSQNHNE